MEQEHFDHRPNQDLLLGDVSPLPYCTLASEESFCSIPGPHWMSHRPFTAQNLLKILKFSTAITVQSLSTKCSVNLVLADFGSEIGCRPYLSWGLHVIEDNVVWEFSCISSPACWRKSIQALEITFVVFLILSMFFTTYWSPAFLPSLTVQGGLVELDSCWLLSVNRDSLHQY